MLRKPRSSGEMSIRVAQRGIIKPNGIARPTVIGTSIRKQIATHKSKQKKVSYSHSVRSDKVSKGPKVGSKHEVDVNTVSDVKNSEPTHENVLAMLIKALEQAIQFRKMIATEAKKKPSTGSSKTALEDEELLEDLLSKREHQKVLAALRSAQLQALKKQKPIAAKPIKKQPALPPNSSPDDEELLEDLASKREHHKVIAALNKFLLQALRQRKPKPIPNPSSEDDELFAILESGHQQVIAELDTRLSQALKQQKSEAIPKPPLSSPEGDELFEFLQSGHQPVIDELDKRLSLALKQRTPKAIGNPVLRLPEDDALLAVLGSGHQDVIDELDHRLSQALELQKPTLADRSLLGHLGISHENEEVPAAQRQIKVDQKVKDFSEACAGNMCKKYSEFRAKGFAYKRLGKYRFLDQIESELQNNFEMTRMAIGKENFQSYKYDEDEKRQFIESIREYFFVLPDPENCRSDLSVLMRKLPLPTKQVEQPGHQPVRPPSLARPKSAHPAESPRRLGVGQPRLVRSASPQRTRRAQSRMNKSMPSAAKHERGWLHQLQNPPPAEKIQEKVLEGLKQLQVMKSREKNSNAIKAKLSHLTKRFCAIYAANHNATRLGGFKVWSQAFLANINPILNDLEAYYKDLPHAASKIFNREQVALRLRSFLIALYNDTKGMTMSEIDCEEIVSNRIAASAELAQLKKLQEILRGFVQQMQELLQPFVPSDVLGENQFADESITHAQPTISQHQAQRVTSLSKVPSKTIQRRPLMRPRSQASSPQTPPDFNRPFEATSKYLSTVVDDEGIALRKQGQSGVERFERPIPRDEPTQSEGETNRPITQHSTQRTNRSISRIYSIIADTSFELAEKGEISEPQKRRSRGEKRMKDQIQPYFIWE